MKAFTLEQYKQDISINSRYQKPKNDKVSVTESRNYRSRTALMNNLIIEKKKKRKDDEKLKNKYLRWD